VYIGKYYMKGGNPQNFGGIFLAVFCMHHDEKLGCLNKCLLNDVALFTLLSLLILYFIVVDYAGVI